MTNEISQPNYEDKCVGAIVGEWVSSHEKKTTKESRVVSVGILEGLRSLYTPLDKPGFLEIFEHWKYKEVKYPDSELAQAAVVAARATLAMCRHEIMPEDLMSLAIDYLPPGLMDDNPLRARLLVAQDYLEERQTLVDNIEAGDLEVDVLGVDIRNMKRCASSGEIAGEIAAAFYAVTALKTSFEEAVELALKSESSELTRLVVGAIAGGQHGFGAIPVKYFEGANYGLRQMWRKLLESYLLHHGALKLAGLDHQLHAENWSETMKDWSQKAEKTILERTGRETLA